MKISTKLALMKAVLRIISLFQKKQKTNQNVFHNNKLKIYTL